MSRKTKMLEQKLNAIMEYLNIDLYEKQGFEVIERKEIGFCERKRL